eukprot:TRINITY_DN167_c0_g1::TRINITY_DN167_c0_g1_i2::g.14210::m.14210 TRINITY_DN167_c0_g1::TRINITY_DN167_c0_g1_i2::g.14210  ORF type:complete len:254 (+),score=20.13,Cupin_2/PF07883.6/4.3e-14,AraC_binding/PF02311.14/1.5e-07,Cupin_3/PF05899.7/0.00057,EutQ/PF06249.7/0.0068,MannoseP_isomer/PF01050.13/0.012,CENP-C_C/PF11699.3/4.1e+03,CENP-C_C/PF11699.3/0.055,Cupin_1/PF00190.17/0.032,DUF1498/PF07385.7/0.052 TRINITY_DN167_c0_g1_i2:69-764(+)
MSFRFFVRILSVAALAASFAAVQIKNNNDQKPRSTFPQGRDHLVSSKSLPTPTINILTRKHETDGAWFEFEEFQDISFCVSESGPGRCSPPPHVHPHQDEIFTVVEGTFNFMLNGETHVANSGSSVTVPKGATHTFWPSGDQNLTVRIRLEPALAGETFFENMWGIFYDSDYNPSLFEVLPVLCAGDVYLGDAPVFISHNVIPNYVCPLLEKMGFYRQYEAYTTTESFWKR